MSPQNGVNYLRPTEYGCEDHPVGGVRVRRFDAVETARL